MYENLNRGVNMYSHIEKTDEGYIHGDLSGLQLKLLKKLDECEYCNLVHIIGNKGTGKKALLKEFLKKSVSKASWLNADELKKTNRNELETIMRNVVIIRFKEQLKIVEGEIMSIKNNRIVLKTVDMESEFDIGAKMKIELEKERAKVGDLIKIYKEAGFVTKIGKSSITNDESEEYLIKKAKIPEGECFKIENINTELTLNEIDIVNCNENGEEDFYVNTHIPQVIRDEVNNQVMKWKKQEKLIYRKGIVIIEDADKLSADIYNMFKSYKNKPLYPLIIFISTIKKNLLENDLFIIKLNDFTEDLIKKIIHSKTKFLGKNFDDDALNMMMEISNTYGINRVFYLIQACTENFITKKILEKADKMFLPLVPLQPSTDK